MVTTMRQRNLTRLTTMRQYSLTQITR